MLAAGAGMEARVMGKAEKQYEGPERRQYVRLRPSASMEVYYSVVPAAGKVKAGWRGRDSGAGQGHSRSVSGGGLFVHLTEVESGQLHDLLHGKKYLALRIQLPGENRPIEALARVMWAEGEDEAGGNAYGCGLSFVEIEEEDRNAITNYVIDSHLADAEREVRS